MRLDDRFQQAGLSSESYSGDYLADTHPQSRFVAFSRMSTHETKESRKENDIERVDIKIEYSIRP
jgi:hypothetical protein